MKKLIIAFYIILLLSLPAFATPYYVRPDGGRCAAITSSGYDATPNTSFAKQCDGTHDASLATAVAAGNDDCACNSPNWVLGAPGSTVTPMMVGGDTLTITGPIQMGCSFGSAHCVDYSVGLNKTSDCYDAWSDGCYTSPIPSGQDSSHKTKIYGSGWDTGCTTKQELWATGGLQWIINLKDSSNVDVQCLKLTDHENCYYSGPSGAGQCTHAYNELSGRRGIYAEDSSNVIIKDVDVIGMSLQGIQAGRLTNWTLENVNVKYSASAGWDGDITGTDSNSGDINWTNVNILYSGCADNYPNDAPLNCCSQDQGCYGDGVGTEATGANWNLVGCNISHNTSDGLDLLYARKDYGGTISIKRSRFEGNAGNQIKLATDAQIENSIIIGNCNYFDGQSFTYNSATFNNCRAGGNTVAIDWDKGMTVNLFNSTIANSEGGTFLSVDNDSDCDGTASYFNIKNNILDGKISEKTNIGGLGEGCSGKVDTLAYNTYNTARYIESMPAGTGMVSTTDNKFIGPLSGATYNVNIASDSPAVNAADETVPVSNSNDYNNFPRGVSWDIGGLEYGSTPEAPSCETSCSSCETSEACAASAYGCFWQLNGTCGTTIDPCNDSCLSCSSQALCEASTIPCYYWSTSQCQATTEELPGSCATDCTLCDSSNCLTTGPSCYLQLDNTCKATIDPCNAYCGDCSTYDYCTQSILGCFWNIDNHCRSSEETTQFSLTNMSLKGFTN